MSIYRERSLPQDSTDIDLISILELFWHKRKLILGITVFFLLLGLLIAKFSPTQYTTKSVIMPQSVADRSGGGLGSIAAVVGVNIGTGAGADGAISPVMYSHIIDSYPFLKDIMHTSITVKKNGERNITLYEYYTDEQYKEFNLLLTIKKYTIGLPKVISSAFRSQKTQNTHSNNTINKPDSTQILTITGREHSVINAIKGAISFESFPKEGYITIGYTFYEPLATAQVSEQLYKTLEKYVIKYKTQKAEQNLAFVEQNYQEAKKDFLQKQANLTAFQDANRALVSATARATENRLSNEYNIAFTVFNELARQREQAQLAVKENRPILTVIDPVMVPLQKSTPQTSKIIIVFTFLGFIIGCVWVFLAPQIKKIIIIIIRRESKMQKI